VLTEHGPKILPLLVSCKQPSASGHFDHETFRATLGFAYSGSSLTALSTHALASTLCANLHSLPQSPSPSLLDVANAIAGIAIRYVREIGELAGHRAFFDAILFGHCFTTRTNRACELRSLIQNDQVTVRVTEYDLRPRGAVAIIGSNPELLRSRIEALQERAEAEVIFDDAPTRALQNIIAEGADESVGGTIQQAWAFGGQFFPVMNVVPIPARPDGTNITFQVLGYDMDEERFRVGNHWAGLFGRY
jgi:hypothetical protein